MAVMVFLQVKAQSPACTSSLGHWLIQENFGSGVGIGPPLPYGVTTLGYAAGCPGDSQYTLVNSESGCNDAVWHIVKHDHTGNKNGYMMLINASSAPSAFYTKAVPALCPNTEYEFSAYILNLIKLEVSDSRVQQPDILFSIQTGAGQILDTLDTGIIPPTSSPQWNRYSLIFRTPYNVTDLVLKISNKAPGGTGNDLLMDDIEFVTHGPPVTIPTAFSPNGDGINDVWQITNLADYIDCVITVFDRYGRQVFKSTGYGTPWNGTDKGRPLEAGTYYYVLDLKNHQPVSSGWVLLVK